MASSETGGDSTSSDRLYLALADAVLARLRQDAHATPIPWNYAPYTEFMEHGWSTSCRPEAFLYFLRLGALRAIDMPELERFANALRDAGIISFRPEGADGEMPESPFDIARSYLTGLLVEPILDAINRTASLEPSHDELLGSYSRYRPVWQSGGRTYNVLAPLHNLHCEASQVLIGKSATIFEFTPEEKTKVWNTHHLADMWMMTSQFSTILYALSSSYHTRDYTEAAEVYSFIPRLITAFRLAAPGDVGTSFVMTLPEPEFPWNEGGGTSTRFLKDYQSRENGTPYHLDGDSLSSTEQILQMLERAERSATLRPLDITLRRFNQSYVRDILEDRLIDLTISLESCLLSREREELRYRISLRGAALLAGERERSRVAALLAAMYDVRSAIVHGGSTLNDGRVTKLVRKVIPSAEPVEFVVACEDVTRSVIRAYVRACERGTTPEKMNDALDALIVSGMPQISEPHDTG
jgi:hypothetical protein